jgi:histidinol-phosphate/aromatic aminotransferase/cobyric acid decarboxylase-like protein
MNIMTIQGYPDPGEGLRLHLNENTGGCSPRVLEAIRASRRATWRRIRRTRRSCARCASHFGCRSRWVLLTNGLDEGILMAAVGHIARMRAFDAKTIIPLPAFDPYPNSHGGGRRDGGSGAPAAGLRVSSRRGHRGDYAATRMIFLNTPNNPTGNSSRPAISARIAEAAPHAWSSLTRRISSSAAKRSCPICLAIRTCSSAARSRRRTDWPACASAS